MKPPVLHKNNFDWLRLAFASMVVLYHAAILSQRPELSSLLHVSATFAVQAFFVVSGYLVTMSCEKSGSLVDYFKKRFTRIAPAYIFVVVAAAILLSALSTLSLEEYFGSKGFWRYIGMNLALSNFAAPSLPGVFTEQYESAVNVSLWTIKIEVLFYASTPVVVWAIRRLGYRPVLAAIFLLSIAWMVGFSVLGERTGNEFYLKLAKQLPGQMAFFAGGAWCYYAKRDGFRIPVWAALTSIVVYAVTQGWLWQLFAPLTVTAVVGWAALTLKPLGDIGKHGDFSFGIYLFHVPVIQTLVALGWFAASPILTLALVLVIVLLAAVFSWNFIEKPFLNHRKEIPIKTQVINC